MDPTALGIVAAAIAGSGLLIAALSWPLLAGKVKPNSFYGFRTPRLVADERLWYPANRIMGRNSVFAGFAMVIGAGLLALLPPATEGALVAAIFALTLGPLVAAMIHGFYAASRMVAELDGIAPRAPAAAREGGAGAAEKPRKKQRNPTLTGR